jgi:cytoskeletal protein RodZ
MRALGEEFRAAREARGLSLSDVAEQIHIRSVYLQALESEDWATIGAAVYVRGFIRTYARFLGVDAEAAVQSFNESGAPGAPAPVAQQAGREASEQRRARRPSPMLWAAGTLAVLLVAAVLYKYVSLQIQSRTPVAVAASPAATASVAAVSTPVAEVASAEPSASATTTPLPTVPPTKTLTVRLSEASWLRVVIDGHNDMEGLFPSGTLKTFHGKVADVRIGNAGGVELDVNGKDLGKLGNSGDVVERTLPLGGE